MPRISLKDIVNYLEYLADQHVDLKSKFRWNINEVSGAMRNGVELPLMAIDSVETRTKGDASKTLHANSIAFTILGKPNTKTGNLDESEAQTEVLDFCQNICFDIEARMLYDSRQLKDKDGNKNWLYRRFDKTSFHFFKVGPVYTDSLFGYRCELSFDNQESMDPEITKWADLD